MKMKFWSVCGVMMATSLLAQGAPSGSAISNTDSIPAPPIEASAAAATSAPPASVPAAQPTAVETKTPAVKPAKKPVKKKAAPRHQPVRRRQVRQTHVAESRTIPLTGGPAVVVATHVNLRGRAGFIGEVLGQMTNGEPVTVIREVHLKHSGAEEPSAWAKIALPARINAWVFAHYINPTNHAVTARRLNIRGGPGENYSILGRLQRGETVQEITTRGPWMRIEAPTNAYAFMAAEYLSQASTVLASVTPSPTETETNMPAEAVATNAVPAATIAGEPSIAAPSTNAPALAATEAGTNEMTSELASMTNQIASADTNEMASLETNELAEATNELALSAAAQKPPPPRIVEREGIVRYTFSIQAPTRFELISPYSHQTIDYLYTTSTNLDLNRYKGLRIIVTGQEGLDARWKNTPVITIRKIQVIQ